MNKTDNALDIICKLLQDKDFLSDIHSIGPETISACIDYFGNPANIDRLHKLQSLGMRFDNRGDRSERQGDLQYVRFAITGERPVSRSTLTQHLVKLGAICCPNITKSTNLLLCGTAPSSKLAKAQKQGIDIVYNLEELSKYLQIDIDMQDNLTSGGLFG